MGLLFAGFLFFSGLFASQFPLAAQTPDAGTPIVDESSIIIGEALAVAQTPAGGSSIFIVLRMVLVLALAALAIYGVVFFIKRLARPQESRDPHLKVLARTALSNDSFAAVLSVGQKAWLVAGGSGGVNLISEIDETESLETMLLEEERRISEAGNRPLIDFRSLLSKFGAGQKKDIVDSHAGNASLRESGSLSESLRKQRERLGGQ